MKIILTLERLFHPYYKYYYHLAPLLNFISFTTDEAVVENVFFNLQSSSDRDYDKFVK